MYSFYGGQPGKDFKISATVGNKKELVSDLSKRWVSNIMPGEYVLVSYGSYGVKDTETDTQYQKNYEIDKAAYGLSYNSTLWEKIYYEPTAEDLENLKKTGYEVEFDNYSGNIKITDTEGVTKNINGVECIFYSNDYGLGYKLISAFGGSTPQIKVKNPSIVLGPLEDPNVTINSDDINNPELTFSLPRATRFFYGTMLGADTTPTEEEQYTANRENISEDIALGDYYINKDTGYIFFLQEIQGDVLFFKYKGCFQPPAPRTNTIEIDSFFQAEDGEFYPNVQNIEFEKIVNGWQANYYVPKSPKVNLGMSSVGPEETGSIQGRPVDKDNYELEFYVPRGSKHFTGDEVEGEDTSDFNVTGASDGDIYVNTNQASKYNGYVYKLIKRVWKKQGSIRGPIGEALKVKKVFNITESIVPNDTVEAVGTWLDEQGIPLNRDEIFVVNYVTNSNVDTSYWYYKIEDIWYRSRLTGGFYSILKDEYIDSTEDYIYSTKYINNLIVNDANSNIVNSRLSTYSRELIDAKLQAVNIRWKNV